MVAPQVSAGVAADLRARLRGARIVFWDFDGVIKDSVSVKSDAFERLFSPFGPIIAARVRQHHEANGGVSRFEKIPLYLGWAGESATTEKVREYCDRFGQLALQVVIDSPWVPGVREYLRAHYAEQHFVLVTATPQEEIEQILRALQIAHWFRAVYGAPTSKADAVRDVLRETNIFPQQALMVGDAQTDMRAAEGNHVPFLLRRTPLNRAIQDGYTGLMFDDIGNE